MGAFQRSCPLHLGTHPGRILETAVSRGTCLFTRLSIRSLHLQNISFHSILAPLGQVSAGSQSLPAFRILLSGTCTCLLRSNSSGGLLTAVVHSASSMPLSCFLSKMSTGSQVTFDICSNPWTSTHYLGSEICELSASHTTGTKNTCLQCKC